MSTRSRNRLVCLLVAVASLFFMQLAVAGYACSGAAKGAEMAAMVQAGMACAESMASTADDEQPELCHAHCQTEHQSADKYQVPAVATLADPGWRFSSLRAIPVPLGAPLQAPLLVRSTAPPLAVRHCCFRI